MKTMISTALTALLLAAAPAAAESTPKATFSVPAACAGVHAQVYTELDASWQITVLAPTAADESLPSKDERDAFVSSVPKLDAAIAGLDGLDQDAFVVRVKTRSLSDLKKKYPKVDAKLLEAAKLQACREAAGR